MSSCPTGRSGRRQREVLLAGRPSPGASPRPTGPRHAGLWPPWSISPSVLAGMAWASATPAPGGRAARSQVALGEARLPAQEDEENATFVSGSHLALAARGGGPEAAAAARPRPPGIFERCSWVLAGWPTWPRRAARPPNPPPRGGGGRAEGERREEAGASGHSAAGRGGRRESGPAQARPGASPPRGRAAGPRRHVGAAGPAGLLRASRQPGCWG